MPRNHRIGLIEDYKADARRYLEEVAEADDLDLWEEMIAKMWDVLVVYHDSQRPAPTTFKFSDGITRNIDAMAFAHAVAEEFPELDGDEFPAWMGRGEAGA